MAIQGSRAAFLKSSYSPRIRVGIVDPIIELDSKIGRSGGNKTGKRASIKSLFLTSFLADPFPNRFGEGQGRQ